MKSTSKELQKKKEPLFTENEKKLALVFREIERGDSDKMNEDHISEVLSQRRKVHEYIHEENMQFHERFKIDHRNNLIKWGGIIGFVVFILLLVVYNMPAYLPEALRIVVAFLGGIGIGKGLQDASIQREK